VIEDVALQTYREEERDLSPEDAAFLDTQLGRKITVRRAMTGSGYLIDPQQYAGVVALPSGARLNISPRIPTSNLLYMLSIAYKFPPSWLTDVEQYETLWEVLDPIAEFFADLVTERIEEGLYRAYVETEGNLAAIRGRIDFPRDVLYNSVQRERTYCRYSVGLMRE